MKPIEYIGPINRKDEIIKEIQEKIEDVLRPHMFQYNNSILRAQIIQEIQITLMPYIWNHLIENITIDESFLKYEDDRLTVTFNEPIDLEVHNTDDDDIKHLDETIEYITAKRNLIRPNSHVRERYDNMLSYLYTAKSFLTYD